jgi:hypothetical protein
MMLKTDNSASVLIISNEHDIHLSPVIEKLSERGVSFFRLNTENLFSKYFIDLSYRDGKLTGSIINNVSKDSIRIECITSVWERRPMAPMNTFTPVHEDYADVIAKEQKSFYQQLRYALKDRKWIGYPMDDLQASSKIYQKIIALEVGFNIPKTIISNRFSALQDFISDRPYFALKPMKADSIQIGDDHQMVFYSRKVTKDQLNSLDEGGFSNAPNFIEEYIEKKYEVRLTFVGKKAFAAKIESQTMREGEGKEDWREGYDHGIRFTKIELEDPIFSKCVNYLRRLNLNFGCFDFVVTQENEFVFLECNPNGQWLWIEEETKMDISGAIADWLISADN